MKILTYLNVSNISLLEADSGFIFMRSIFNHMSELGNQIVFIGPPNMPDLDKNITQININFSESKYGVRFGLNWIELQNKLKPYIDDLDLIWVNQSELSVPLSILVEEIRGVKIPLLTYYHYLSISKNENDQITFDNSLNLNGIANFIWKRQVESAEYSDINIIGSEFGKGMFVQASKKENLKDSFFVVPPPVQKIIQEPIKTNNDIPILMYNHRLYNHYGFDLMFNSLEKVYKKFKFKVIVTDPTHKRSLIRNQLDNSVNQNKEKLSKYEFVEITHFNSQEEYYDAITKIDIGLGPIREGPLWSMAIADMLAMGKPVLAFREGAFPEISLDEDLLFDTIDEFENKLLALMRNYSKLDNLSIAKKAERLSIESITQKFLSIIKNNLWE